MANVRRTAMGGAIDMDRLRLTNENTIAIGNARTNARGDQLGPGGKVIKTRAQLQQEYYKLNTPVADNDTPVAESTSAVNQPVIPLLQPTAEDTPVAESSSYVKPRGSFAESVASETEIKTELLDPLSLNGSNKSTGIKRI
jgi:hypothetical protein